MTIDLHVSHAPEGLTTRPAETGTTATPPVYLKSCCQVPREQPCAHDLPAAVFEPGCRTAIMCRPASQWGA